MITLTFDTPVTVLDGDSAPKLSGRAVPFGIASLPSTTDQKRYRFARGDADLIGTVAVREHDDGTPIGTVTASESTDSGIDVEVTLLGTNAGRDAHIEAQAGVRNGFSLAFDPIRSEIGDDDVVDVTEYNVLHLGHVRRPAFGEATVAIAASTKEGSMPTDVLDPVAEPPVPTAPRMLSVKPRSDTIPTLAQYGYAVISNDLAKLSAYREAINLAAGETLVADTPGIIPTPVLAPILDGRPYDRPIFSALGPYAGPTAGASWTHPVVSDPIADAAIVAELVSANDTLGITPKAVAWKAIKRSTLVSREDQIYSEPAVIGIIGDQLARAYARGSEVIAAQALTTATGGNTAIVLALNGSDATGKIVGGSLVHYQQVGAPADILVMNPVDYAKVASWVATDGRALFPSAGQLVNGSGETGGATSFTGNVAGVRLVVSWALTAGQNYLLSSDYVRTYEGNRATISVESAAFGVTLGIFGTVAAVALLPKAVTPVSISATTELEAEQSEPESEPKGKGK